MKKVIALTATVLALIIANQATAQIIYGCLGKGGDLTRVTVGTPPTCKGGQTQIWWNVQGPPGPQGQQGEPGAPGLQLVRTIFVSPTGNAQHNGLQLRSALAGIADSGAGNPYLVKIEPGVFDIGNNTLAVPEYVALEGSGAGVTRIQACVGIANSIAAFVFVLESNTALRDLAIEFSATAVSAVDTGAVTTSGQNVSISDVRIKGPGGSHEGVRGHPGAVVRLAHIDLSDVQIAVRQTLAAGTIEFEGLRTEAVILAEDGGTIVGRNSIVGTVDTNGTSTLRFANTQIAGSTAEEGTATCVYSYNNNLVPLDTSCE
jgi:hypothetical protein